MPSANLALHRRAAFASTRSEDLFASWWLGAVAGKVECMAAAAGMDGESTSAS